MTTPQILSIATLLGVVALLISGRFRCDVTTIIALFAALALGIVSPRQAFSGLSDDVVVIVASAPVLPAAMQGSGVIEHLVAFITRHVRRARGQLIGLTTAIAPASALVKNVGALAMLMPVAFQMARKSDSSPSGS